MQIGSGTSYGHLLTLDCLINTIKELLDYSSGTTTYTLTIGSANAISSGGVWTALQNKLDSDGGITKGKIYYTNEAYPYVPVADLTSGFLYHDKNGTTLTPKTLKLSDISDANGLLSSDNICELSLGVFTGIYEGSTTAQIGTNAGYSWIDYNPSSDSSTISIEVAGANAVKTLANAYKSLTSSMKYVHNIKVTSGGASGSCEFYFTIYNTSATALTISDLVSTYGITNKLTNISGYASTTSGTTPVFNVVFESNSSVHFNNTSITISGSTLSVTDTIVGRVVSA